MCQKFSLLQIALISCGLFFAHKSEAQCTATSTGCANEVIWYLDVDGDGVGVDDAAWNRYCCGGETPSAMYSGTSGDIRPNDPSITTSITAGCTFEEACNYDASANTYDGTCRFPTNCRTCELDSGGNKTGNYDPAGPCGCDIDAVTGDTTLYYKDVLNVCGGDCAADNDNDGICDITLAGDTIDPCWVVGQVPDDCGNCAAAGGGRQFITSQGLPCSPGDPDCEDQNGYCNCQNDVTNSCGVCAEPEPQAGYDCNGNLDCTDDIPAGGNGICDEFDIKGCTDSSACNYENDATYGVVADECAFTTDECGVCGGDGIPTGACDCTTYPEPYKNCDGDCLNDADQDGICDELEILGCTDPTACNYDENATENSGCVDRDIIGECGGDCTVDVDADGICDDDDDCVGQKDICGVCNGSGIPPGDCDCFGHTLDILNECGGGCIQDADSDGICDLDENGNVADSFICLGTADAIGVCNGTCTADADEDGVCDDVDPCVGTLDACGICNGSGIPEGDCDCNGNTSDAIGVCGGGCQTDADQDGICDDNGNDGCLGTLDECGVCDGSGIPEGDCDCYGNQLDVLGNCGGKCLEDTDGDGICDLDTDGNVMDGCVGVVDACGVCNGTGPLPGCGCEPVLRGECDCNGNVIDECGVCGGDGPDYGKDCNGDCLADEDNDGICDAFDPRIIPRVFVGGEPTLDAQMNLPPFDVQDAYADLVELHRKMGDNLDDGSLTGTAKHLTVQDHIYDKGKLLVGDTATFESNVVVNGFVQVDKSLDIDGDFIIDGVTFSNGGIESSTVDNSGDLKVEGSTTVAMNTEINGAVTTTNVAGTSGDFRVHDGLVNGEFDPTFARVTFSVAPSTGNVRMSGDLDADADVNITGKTTLNGLNVDGKTRFKNVTMDGALDLNSSAEIKQSFRINGSQFTINGETGNTRAAGDMVVVGNMTVHGLVHISKDMTIVGTTFANGGVQTTSVEMKGDLQVGGNTNIGKDFSVGGETTVLNDLNLGSEFSIFDGSTTNFESSQFHVSPSTGNLTSQGKYTGQAMSLSNDVTIRGNLSSSSNINVTGATSLDGMQVSGTSTFRASTGGVSFRGNTTIQGATSIQGNLTTRAGTNLGGLQNNQVLTVGQISISSNPGVGNYGLDVTGVAIQDSAFAKFTNESATGHGIKIQLGRAAPDNGNDYVKFLSSGGTLVGRIEGETTDQLGQNEMWQFEKGEIDRLVSDGSTAKSVGDANLTTASLSLAAAIAKQVAACVSFTGCAGFGFCAAMPIPALIVGSIANVVSAGVGLADAIVAKNHAVNSYNRAVNVRSAFEADAYTNDRVSAGGKMVGVTYQSGSADYAEWLPKADLLDEFEPGQVIGIHDGKVSLVTEKADKVFVVSTQPIVLGNSPVEGSESNYVKAAFLGQVPVHVKGVVRTGDFILASGENDGLAIAVPPDELRGIHLPQVVGIAWETGLAPLLNVVNVAVGLNDGLQVFAAQMDRRLDALASESDALEKLIKAQMRGEDVNLYTAQKAGLVPAFVLPEDDVQRGEPDWTDPASWSTATSSDFVQHEITEEAMEYSWELAVEQAAANGINVQTSPTWQLYIRDASARADFLERLRQQINDHNAEIIASLDGYQNVNMFNPTSAEQLLQENVKSANSANSNAKRQ